MHVEVDLEIASTMEQLTENGHDMAEFLYETASLIDAGLFKDVAADVMNGSTLNRAQYVVSQFESFAEALRGGYDMGNIEPLPGKKTGITIDMANMPPLSPELFDRASNVIIEAQQKRIKDLIEALEKINEMTIFDEGNSAISAVATAAIKG